MRSILDGVTLGSLHWAEVYHPAIVEGDLCMEQEVCVATGCTLVQMHVTDWVKTQKEDAMLSTVLNLLKALLAEHSSSEEGRLILHNWQNFMIHQGALYLHPMSKGETENLLFVVPKAHHITTLKGCHQDMGHQGCDHTLSCYRSISGDQV